MKKIIIVILGILLAGITTASAEEKLEKYEWMQEKLDINPFDFLYMQGESILYTINEQIPKIAQSYPTSSNTTSKEAPLFITLNRFLSSSVFNCSCM